MPDEAALPDTEIQQRWANIQRRWYGEIVPRTKLSLRAHGLLGGSTDILIRACTYVAVPVVPILQVKGGQNG